MRGDVMKETYELPSFSLMLHNNIKHNFVTPFSYVKGPGKLLLSERLL